MLLTQFDLTSIRRLNIPFGLFTDSISYLFTDSETSHILVASEMILCALGYALFINFVVTILGFDVC